MSDLYDEETESARPSGRLRMVMASLLVVVLVVVLVNRFAAFYTDHLWYDSVHAGGVFSTLFWTKLGLFLVFGLVMALAVAGSMVLAFRARPFFSPAEEHSSLARYRDAITPIRTWLLIGTSAVCGIFAGVSAAGRWRTFLLWRHGGSFGQKDSHFHKDVGFYVFDLPWWHYLVDFALTAAVLALLAGVLVHYLYGGIRLQGSDRMSSAAQAQVSLLLGVLVLLKGVDYWLDLYDLVHSSGPLFTGIGFTDDHAVLPAKNILTGIALICAVLLFLNVWRRTWELPSVGLALMVLSAVLLGLIWPAIVQGVQVDPSRSEKEKSYVEANIAATRSAYAIDDKHVQQVTYQDKAKATKASAGPLDQQTSSLPVADPVALQDQFEQTQQLKSYFQVTDPLDVDHYPIDGKDRAVVLGVREVKDAGITNRNWANLHTVYTHSDGVVAAYANQRDRSDTTESNAVQWAQTSGLDDLSGGKPFQDQIYYGEDSPSYSVVGRPKGGSSVELDLGGRDSDSSTTTTYAGKGGVPISSAFRRALYAVKFGTPNFLLSSQVNDQSKVLYNRDPKTAVRKVAPWLTLDGDPYPVVEGGRIVWVVDGYTTTDDYPESERSSLSAMTQDATQADSATLRALPTDDINYMRNSVKATVDAYDGTVTLYEWDKDPILSAWESVFPGLVKPKADIPAGLMSHLRYPSTLYKVQRYQLARYHVTDATDFLQDSDRWAVPASPSLPAYLQPPARMFLDNASGKQTWSMTSTFVPATRSNLAAIMTVDSAAGTPGYGKIQLLTGFDQNALGPGQVFSQLGNNTKIAEAVGAFARSGSTPVYGNLLTVPLAQAGLLYVEPVYAVQATGSSASYAVLAYVLVSYDGQLGYGPTLGQALADALTNGGEGGGSPGGSTTTAPSGSSSATPSGSPTGSASGSPSQSASGRPSGSTSTSTSIPPTDRHDVAALLADAKTLFAQADQAGKSGNFPRRERLLEQAQAKVDKAAALLSGS